MKCSNCKLEGYNKNNCPRCKEKNEERINRLLEILPFETVFVSIAYFSLSQTIQKQGTVTDLLGSAGDLAALRHPNAGIALGGMLSLAYEGTTEGWTAWLEEQFGKVAETVKDPVKFDIHKGFGF
tara:strand:+ start:99 stop:473 length:375 start_codon:yes stop_codon:yes gene_type:complete